MRPRLAVQRLWQVLSLKEVQPHPDKNIWLQLTKFKWTNSNHKLQHLWRTCILGGYPSGQEGPFLWTAPRGCSFVPVLGVIIWSWNVTTCAVDRAFRSRWLDQGPMLTSSLVTFVVLAFDLGAISRQQICNLFSATASFISTSFLNVFLCRPNSNHWR